MSTDFCAKLTLNVEEPYYYLDIYALTEKGREILRRWLIEPVARQIGRHEILLKLFFG